MPCSWPDSVGPAKPSAKSRRDSFAFLDRRTTFQTFFRPIGNDGWYPRGKDKALYDQQPVEALTMADAALAAFDLLGDESFRAAFNRAYGWFHGRNSLRQSLVDAATGACCDGLQASGVNRNQGAGIQRWLTCSWNCTTGKSSRPMATASARLSTWHDPLPWHWAARAADAPCDWKPLMHREASLPRLYTELFQRHPANPILTAQGFGPTRRTPCSTRAPVNAAPKRCCWCVWKIAAVTRI